MLAETDNRNYGTDKDQIGQAYRVGAPKSFSYPSVKTVMDESLQYSLSKLNEEDLVDIVSRIGSKINRENEEGKKTALRNFRFSAWGPLVCALTTTALSMAAPSKTFDRFFQSFNLPNVVPGICVAMIVTSIANLIICYYLPEDSSTNRTKKSEEILKLSFIEIADKNALDDVLGLDLLDKTIEKLNNLPAKPVLYKKFNDLFNNYLRIQDAYAACKEEIEMHFTKHEKVLEKKLAELVAYIDEEGDEHIETFPTGLTSSSSMENRSKDEKKLIKWHRWREEGIDSITKEFNEAVELLNTAYDEQKLALQL